MKNHRSIGFTLIELLVVVAVIALLIGLLLPALSSASENARNIQCVNNQRQLGIVVNLYADDYDGVTPLGFTSHWAYSFALYDNASGSTTAGFYCWGLPWEYGYEDTLSNNDIVFCPSRRGPDWVMTNIENWPPGDEEFFETETHYAMRPFLDAESELGWRQDPKPSFPPNLAWSDGPARRALMRPTSAILADATPDQEFLELGHPNAINATYLDGHVASTQREQIDPLFESIPQMRAVQFGGHREVQRDFWTKALDRGGTTDPDDVD